jgi:hypothetical protein
MSIIQEHLFNPLVCLNTIRPQIAILGVLLLALVDHAGATAEYEYKPGELLVIKDGKSPDKKFSIVSGDADRKGGFGGVYLTDAQTKEVLGKLDAVATTLDSAPDAYRAHWSPDSKHVGVTSRAERHWAENVIYRIENRRAYFVDTPELLCHAVPKSCALTEQLGGGSAEDKPEEVWQKQRGSEIVKWISPTRFVVFEEQQWKVKMRDPTATLGNYARVEKDDSGETDNAASLYYVWFKAEGECELLPGDKMRVVSTRPVKDQKADE